MVNLQVRRQPVSAFFDAVFDDVFGPANATASARSARRPTVTRARMDVIDQGDRFRIVVDLPGVKKEDIHVSVEGGRVSVRAESARSQETRDGDRVLHAERVAASYARSIELPTEVTDEDAEATFDNGVLTLTLSKRAKPASRRVTVN